jgi:hypothetical protein
MFFAQGSRLLWAASRTDIFHAAGQSKQGEASESGAILHAGVVPRAVRKPSRLVGFHILFRWGFNEAACWLAIGRPVAFVESVEWPVTMSIFS